MPARARASSRAVATKLGAALLETVGLGERLVGVGRNWHVRSRKKLLPAFVLVREDADVVLVCSRYARAIIQDDERKEAAMVPT